MATHVKRLNFKKSEKPAGLRKAIFEVYPYGEVGWVASVYDGIAAKMDTDGGGFGGRWSAVCELHGEICCCATYALALSAANSREFCEECQQSHEWGEAS